MKFNWMWSLILLAALGFTAHAEEAKKTEELKPAADEKEFKSMFNGKDLAGWEGDPTFWRVEDGMIIGETTKEKKMVNGNTFLIATADGKDATYGDFEFRVSFRFAADRPFGNSGIQYRSKHFPDNKENKWVVGGYQADCDLKNQYTGICYEEKGRGIFCKFGKNMTVAADGKKTETGTGATEEQLKAARKPAGEWNDYIVICKGSHCVQILNGVVVAEFNDVEKGKSAATGILALQMHAGAAMKIDFKNPRIMVWDKK